MFIGSVYFGVTDRIRYTEFGYLLFIAKASYLCNKQFRINTRV